MILHIIATGETASQWDGLGPSIGVNDCYKWGHKVDNLLLLNHPNQFQPSRLETILKTKCDKVYTNVFYSWERHFKNLHTVSPLRRWSSGSPLKGSVFYHASTSPIVALSMGYNWGHSHLIMWGVDMMNHHKYGTDQPGHVREMRAYHSFITALKNKGVQVYIGAKGTAFDNMLPVWEPKNILV
jgi:hypothetical protein